MRGRAKGKKLSVTNQDENGSGEEEKIPVQKRRGRPQKPLKDEVSDEEAQKLEDEEDSDGTTKIKNGKKRKRNNNNNNATEKVKEKVEAVLKEENGNGERPSNEESSKNSIGFRQNGNRRKSKPRRAAEAVVECN